MMSLEEFYSCRRGNVAVMFGLLAIPIFGLVGAAIDYALAVRDRGSMQEAIDAGALAGSRLLNVQTAAQARAHAEALTRINLPAHLRTLPLDIQIVNNGQSIRITTARSVPTSILQIVGRSSIDVSATTTATAPAYREIELVLALDNTGSMAQSGKMTALREATLELLTLLENSGRRPGDVRVGIVPFTTVVRVDANTYRNASWLRNESSESWETSTQDWDGCIADRRDDPSAFYALDTAPNTGNTRFPRAACSFWDAPRFRWIDNRSLARLQPLTTNFATLRALVNAMTPQGNTNVTIGFAWGWHLLSANEPFTETQTTSESDVDRWLVVLTDGDNTQDRWSTSQSAIDARTRQACDNLRAQANDIRVMTVRVMEGNASLLRSCASNENYYYEVSSAGQLIEVFRRIAWEITALRLTN